MSERDAPARLTACGLHPTDYAVTRIAITRRDVEDLREFRDPVKPSDSRTPAYVKATGLRYGVELEALDSRVLRERVDAAIRARITHREAWRRTVTASQAVQESWQSYADRWRPPTAAIRGLGAE
jgi:hypothetical protein